MSLTLEIRAVCARKSVARSRRQTRINAGALRAQVLNIAVEEEGENCKSLFSARGGMRQLRCNTHCAAVGVERARDLNGEITVLPPLPSSNGNRSRHS